MPSLYLSTLCSFLGLVHLLVSHHPTQSTSAVYAINYQLLQGLRFNMLKWGSKPLDSSSTSQLYVLSRCIYANVLTLHLHQI